MVKEIQQDFKDKTVLITGGARNIGLAIAKDLATRGASVAIADICRDLETVPYRLSSSDDLEKSVAELTSSGVKAIGLTCDVRDENQVRSAVAQVIKAFGHLDILVNNAGVISLFPISELTASAWNEVLDVCLKGTFFCCKHAITQMVEQQYGKIVNISSVAGLRGLGLSVHYAAAKHGVIGLTKALAMEVANHNINVNAICPGTVESPMLAGLASQIDLDKDAYEHFSQGHLIQGKRITPQDIAYAVRWLASEESRFLTGTVISIDAGWLAKG
ncbi:MAG: mycofactocin-coupled SDR family oxidoreductase [SAR324 cluster bacterium]|nr:mycofactocin-coupled SDR family oxidoreductase [SAR324 cluster bacterium]